MDLNVKFNGACSESCTTNPTLKIPLTIIPVTHEGSYGFLEPENYQPVDLGYFKFELQQIDKLRQYDQQQQIY